MNLPLSVKYAAPEEAVIFTDHLTRLGLPPMEAPAADRPLIWGDYLLDWGIYGARGTPEDRAYLRGIKRLVPETDPRAGCCTGPYIDASDLVRLNPGRALADLRKNGDVVCSVCGSTFYGRLNPTRKSRRFCSNKCKQQAKRKPQ